MEPIGLRPFAEVIEITTQTCGHGLGLGGDTVNWLRRPARIASSGAWVALAMALFAGCGTAISFTEVQSPPRPLAARPVESVEVFTSGPPSCPHVDVGIFEVEQESEFSLDRTPRMLEKLRSRAAALGCDAVFVGAIGSHTESALLDRHQAVSTKTIQATCIVYTEVPGGPAPVAGQPAMLSCVPAPAGPAPTPQASAPPLITPGPN